jgi:hypothetical protein
MRKVFTLTALALGILLAGPALATDGWTDCRGTTITATAAGASLACAALTGDNPDTTILAVQSCEHFDVIYEPDQSGAGGAIDVQIMSCVTSAVSANTCHAIDGVTLTGTPPNAAIYGAGGIWIWVDGTGTIGAETPIVVVICRM